MSRKKKLIILVVVLAAVIGGYLLVRHFSQKDTPDSDSIDIFSADSDAIEAIKWRYDNSEVELKRDNNDQWYYTGDEDFPLDPEKASAMLSAVSTIKAVKKVTDDPSDLASYGINDPLIKLYVTSGGTTAEYDIGKYNEASGYYYMMYTGDSALYYVDSTLYSTFSVGLLDIVEFEFLPSISASQVESASLLTGGVKYTITADDQNKNTGESKLVYHLSENDTDMICDTETVNNMIRNFTDIKWMSCAAYNVSQEDAAKYRLDEPLAEFSVKYKYYTAESESASGSAENKNTAAGNDTLLIGGACNDDKTAYYAMIKGGKCVYMLESEIAECYFINNVSEFYSKSILSFDKSDLTSIVVNYKDSEYKISVSSEESQDDYGYDSVLYTYKCNGAVIKLDDFINEISSFKAESVSKSDITGYGDKLLSVTVKLSDNITHTVEIFKYDDDYCVVGCDGSTRFFADESKCDDIYNYFKNAVKNME